MLYSPKIGRLGLMNIKIQVTGQHSREQNFAGLEGRGKAAFHCEGTQIGYDDVIKTGSGTLLVNEAL